VQITADGAHDNLARVQADPDADGDAFLAAHAFGVSLHGLLHPERRIARPHGVIFMGERRAEERHDPVAHDLVDRAFVAVDGLHHPFEDGIENLARLLGVAVGEQLHGALEVGKEDCHLLALAFEGRLRVEDAFGEVLGGVRLRRGRLSRNPGARGYGLAALEAEPRPARQFCAAGGAGQREAASAPKAEPGMGRVLLLAPGAFHAHSHAPGAAQVRRR